MIEKNEIENKIGELLAMIENDDLRAKTLAAFMLAIEEGGWRSMDELAAMPFTLLTDTKGINFWEHTIAVTKGAVGLAQGQLDCYDQMPYAIDMDRLIAGGLLHDVGKLLEFELTPDGDYVKSHAGKCTRHPISGAVIAARVGLPTEIQNIIACHAKEGDGRPKVIEAVLIHQSDFATFDPLVMLTKDLLIE
jgi:putative nucleotidyltransferase with HDIG domain